MNRALDLDTIAPDDPIVTPVSTPAPKVKKAKIKKTVTSEPLETVKATKKVDDILNSVSGDSYSFLVKPKNFTFKEREESEEVLLVLRPHWFSNIKWVLITFLMIFVPSLLRYLSFGTAIFNVNILPGAYEFIATLIWFTFVFIFAFESFLSWYFDLYIITDRRVIDIHFNNLLDVKSSEANIDVIQDVTSRVSGFAQTMFNYGNVTIQTAGTVGELCFEKVPNPSRVTEVLQELKEEIKNEKEDSDNE